MYLLYSNENQIVKQYLLLIYDHNESKLKENGGFQMLKAELSRFKVKEGKSGKVDEWMAFLNEHMEDTLLTLENEKCL